MFEEKIEIFEYFLKKIYNLLIFIRIQMSYKKIIFSKISKFHKTISKHFKKVMKHFSK